jgi:hypothetical protein
LITSSSKTSIARLEDVRATKVERLDRGQQRLLVLVEPDHVLDIRMGELVVRHPGAERVDDADAAGSDRLEQQLADAGVEAVGVGAAVDDVDGVEVERVRLHQRDAERVGRPLVLVVGGLSSPSVSTTARGEASVTAAARSACQIISGSASSLRGWSEGGTSRCATSARRAAAA